MNSSCRRHRRLVATPDDKLGTERAQQKKCIHKCTHSPHTLMDSEYSKENSLVGPPRHRRIRNFAATEN